MASSLPAGFCSMSPLHKHKILNYKFPHARSQSFRDDQGKSADMVDANLSILRKRIDEVRRKEKLMINNSTCTLKHGWNYQHNYDDHKHKRRSNHDIISESLEMVALVSGAVGFVFLSGSLCICLVSILVNLSYYN